MSFLSGILNFGKKAIGFLGGNSIASTLARTAILGYAVNKLSKSALKENDLGNTNNIDKGVRLQLKPDAEAKIPVLYGSAYFGGNITDAAMTNANKTMWYCLVLSEKTGSKYSDSNATNYVFEDVYWNQQRIVFQSDGVTADYTVDRSGTIDRSVSGLVKVYLYAGSSSDGQVPDGYTGTVPNADTLFPNWTSATHPMDDLVFALVRVDYSREKNVTGIGQMLFHVESDMRKPGDAVYDYLTSTVYGAGISSSELKTADFTTLNTHSDTSVNYTDQGTGAATLANRYQINGVIDTKNNVLKNAESILSAAGSYLSYDTHEGKWGIVVNKAETSSASFSDDNILGNISVGGTGLQDLYNSVKVAFPHRDLRDSADFVKIEIPSSDRNANEPDNTLNITYDIINEPVQAEVLGFIELKQSRVDLMIQFETDFSYINLKAGDVIDVTNSRYGFSSKLFRIITITERQDSNGALIMSISALEYDSDVYSTQNITRYTRSDDDGIITIGSIGVPGTPQVTKYERAARPRIEIETTTPTGVVEGVEFWITFDYQETNDDNRSYSLIGTLRPPGGGVYTSGTSITFEYDNIGAQDFFVKVRGINTTTTGPYSAVSGLVEFEPEQVPDAITPDTSILDSTGGLATALGIVTLLNNLDGLFGGDSNTGLFDKIFETFEDVTGFDLVGETQGGNLVVPTNITIKEEGTDVATSVGSINFVGEGLTATATGSDVSVSLSSNALLPDGTANKDILAWNSEAGEWQIIPNCITCDFPEPPPEPEPDRPCILRAQSFYPPDRASWDYSCGLTPPYASTTGSYYVKYDYVQGVVNGVTTSHGWLTQLQVGTGNAKLYKSDGTLVETLTSSQVTINNDVIEFPFADRDPATDYYITIDEGFVNLCDCDNEAIDDGTTWNFTTHPISLSSSALSARTLDTFNAPTYGALTVSSKTPSGDDVCVPSELVLTFSENIATSPSNSVNIVDVASGTTVFTAGSTTGTIDGATITIPVTGLQNEKEYKVTVEAGFVSTNRQPITQCSYTFTPTQTENTLHEFFFNTQKALEIVSVEVCSDPFVDTDNTRVNIRSVVGVRFNYSIEISDSVANGSATLKKQGGTTVQNILLDGTYTDDRYGEIYRTAGKTLYLNPTLYLEQNQQYYVNIDANIIKKANCDEAFAGGDSPSFTTDSIQQVGSPTGQDRTVSFETDRAVEPGTGNLVVKDADGNVLRTIPATNSDIVTIV